MLWTLPARAQTTPTELDESRALRLLDVQTTLAAWQEAGPELALPAPHSLNLNTATADELLALPGATAAGAAAILRYRAAYGAFSELSELNAVEDLPTAQAAALVPYLYVEEKRPGLPRLSEAFGPAAKPWLMLRGQSQWPRATGFYRPDFATGRTAYAGDGMGVLVRLRGSLPSRLSYGLVLEKDPGEALQPTPGQFPRFDYVSANLILRNQGRLKVLALGDYQLAFGQGLAFGRSFILGRGAEPVLTLAQTSPGILPYNALVEGRALRGAAATLTIRSGLEATAFGSAKRVDAVPVQAPDSLAAAAADAVGPPRYAGLHRTAAELAARDALPEYLGGAALQWAPGKSFGHVGMVAVRQVYGRPLRPEALRPGLAQAQTYGSAWYRTRLGSAAFYGEVALREGTAPAYVQTIQWLPTPSTGLAASLRRLPAGSEGSYGQPFQQGLPTAGGEQGLYLAATQRLGRWQLAAYQDYYQPTAATPDNSLPTPQAEWALQSLYTPTKTSEAFVQVRARRSLVPDAGVLADGSALYPTGLGLQGVAGVKIPASEWLVLSTQLRVSDQPGTAAHPARIQGWAAYQQAQLRLGPIRATLRAYVYETEGYAARLVFYEPGVLYNPRALQAYGQGTRLMALIDARLPGWGNLYLKAARTQPLTGDPATELTLQARIWLSGSKGEVREE